VGSTLNRWFELFSRNALSNRISSYDFVEISKKTDQLCDGIEEGLMKFSEFYERITVQKLTFQD
jgi:hypothetical protein